MQLYTGLLDETGVNWVIDWNIKGLFECGWALPRMDGGKFIEHG